MTADRVVQDGVLDAAQDLVAAFAAHDVDRYFAAFADDACFVFHSTPERLGSRRDYRALWERWEAEDGFRVRGCRSSAQQVIVVDDQAAVFVHDVDTELTVGGEPVALAERETIVFRRQDGRWLAVHEHLSPRP